MLSGSDRMRRRQFSRALAGAAVVGCGPRATPGTPRSPEREAVREVAGARLRIRSEGREPAALPLLSNWAADATAMIAAYYGGRMPVPDLELTLVATSGRGVGFGSHRDGRWIRVRYGRQTDAEGFRADWVMVHEQLHACFPDLPDDQRWMQEGLSTYLEPIVRARAGALSVTRVWERWTASMHHGRPGPGDRGLANTHTWGRTYWGGTLFWFMVDLELREASGGRASIRDAVRGIVAAGGNARQDWSTARVCEVGDRATGHAVLSSVFARLAAAPGDVDLDAIWRSLGVRIDDDGGVWLDDTAPGAATRRAITSA